MGTRGKDGYWLLAHIGFIEFVEFIGSRKIPENIGFIGGGAQKPMYFSLRGSSALLTFTHSTLFSPMAAFNKHFHGLGKDDHPSAWPGPVYQCKVMVLKPGVFFPSPFVFCAPPKGKVVPEECGVKVPAKNWNTTGLKGHIRDQHPDEYNLTIQRAGDIQAFFPGSQNAVKRENIAIAFAENALPYQVFFLQFFFVITVLSPSLSTTSHSDVHLVTWSRPVSIVQS